MKINLLKMQFVDHEVRYAMYVQQIRDIRESKRYHILQDYKRDEMGHRENSGCVYLTRRLKRTELKHSKRKMQVINLA